jgi:hypothetical protein
VDFLGEGEHIVLHVLAVVCIAVVCVLGGGIWLLLLAVSDLSAVVACA